MQRLLLELQPHPLFVVSEAAPLTLRETGNISTKGRLETNSRKKKKQKNKPTQNFV